MHSVHPGELVELFSVASGDPAAALGRRAAASWSTPPSAARPPGWGPGSVPVVVVGVVDGARRAAIDAAPYDVVLAADDPMLDAVIANVAAFPIAAAAAGHPPARRASAGRWRTGWPPSRRCTRRCSRAPSSRPGGGPGATRGLPPDDEPPVLADRVGDELRIVLNRPRRHNAVTAALRDGLAEALTLAAVDDTITAVRLSGNGPSFCSGGDLGEFGSFPDPATAHVTRLTRSPARLAHLLADRLHVHLHGACMGAGIEVPAFAAPRHRRRRHARSPCPSSASGSCPAPAGRSASPAASVATAPPRWPSAASSSTAPRRWRGASWTRSSDVVAG